MRLWFPAAGPRDALLAAVRAAAAATVATADDLHDRRAKGGGADVRPWSKAVAHNRRELSGAPLEALRERYQSPSKGRRDSVRSKGDLGQDNSPS